MRGDREKRPPKENRTGLGKRDPEEGLYELGHRGQLFERRRKKTATKRPGLIEGNISVFKTLENLWRSY